mmetsp:Transcript_83896/g.213581  ORF Transcript_83896/g.213581 Transcript_83896/m.213581 type:complete len:233 (+) Transcript_83896:77-775(+)|eukprot:CAMPEP_0183430076 /NCGR_PEP_ID=MMETSP0370-20130417/49295_1 /TAXON_ID=268820 /ORGANISM="Peridinium aciculiferum, Strain PAER-2" /LENGTH=232 /DNA_ID=CAMNT_0025615289 /DNA_START=73 /DNA_END=771 /DNA_ORIENTATION=-
MGGVKGFSGKGKTGKTTTTSAWMKPVIGIRPTIAKSTIPAWTGGAAKGKVAATTTRVTSSFAAPSFSSKGATKGAPIGKSSFSSKGATTSFSSGFAKGGKKGKDKGKGKGKDKGKSAPPANDPFWEQKVSEENRIEGDGSMYTGTISSYNIKGGWGFLLPDDPISLTEDVQAALAEAAVQAEAKGKNIGDPNMLYFRKPDLAEGYKAQKGAAVTFQTYTDDKGAGAHNISGA